MAKPKHLVTIQGSPMECGAQVWEKLCGPAVLAASRRPQTEMTQFYAGILSAAFGSMAADMGHERATHVARTLVESFAGMAAALPGSRTQ